MKDKISELLDDELSDHEHFRMLRLMAQDEELRGTWERYNLVRSALRKELDVMVDRQLVNQISRCIEAESCIPTARKITSLLPMRFTKWAAGLAVAASVTALAIFSLQPLQINNSPVNLAVNLPTGEASKTPPAGNYQEALNTFLVEHSNFIPVTGMNGMMSYVRVVGHNNKNNNE